MEMGSNFKRIRENKGYTQDYVSKGIITQGAYSKFEDNQSGINANAYIHFLNKLHLSADEFFFVGNSYQYTLHQKLVHKFFNLPYNDLNQLLKIQEELRGYLNSDEDVLLQDILIICEALISLVQTNDIVEAQKIVTPVWDRLSKHHQWYLSDFRIINVLLYLFPVDTAIEVTRSMLNRLRKYNGFRDTKQLKFTYRINLSLLLIKSQDYQSALNVIQGTIAQFGQYMPHQSLALSFSRKAICLHNLGFEDSDVFLHKSQQLLDIYQNNDLWKSIINEYYIHCK